MLIYTGMAGNGWEWLGMAVIGFKQLEIAQNDWNAWKWLGMAGESNGMALSQL